ncbi:MAG: hypothetical protein U9O41_01430, partial [Candidatus Aerophobetes bacterium]|nr:hypothetical protein [Candidatus Aerophobetes bacterium]
LGDFWSVTEENRFGRIYPLFGWFGSSPYTLYTEELRVLGKKADLYFRFVNAKLFEIEIKGETIYKKAELEGLKTKLESALVAKYGKPIGEEKSEEENLLEFINEEEIIRIYQERLNYLWRFNDSSE